MLFCLKRVRDLMSINGDRPETSYSPRIELISILSKMAATEFKLP
ncbi:hypothetical protein [Sodalinema gerasimenkoae]|nr:hypothetical protein [Sodalinema gerasimenkoae]